MNWLGLTQIGITLTATLAVSLTSEACAQEPQSAANQIPTVPYIDKAFGFELQVPAGWTYDRTGFFGPGGSLGLLRGAAPNGRASLQILAFRELKLPSFPDWVEFFSKQLGSISGTKQVRVKGVTEAERPAAYVVVEAQLGIDHTRTLYYCVQFDAETIWVLSYATALDRSIVANGEPGTGDSATDVAIPTAFRHLAATLRVFYDPEVARQLAVALQHGKDYLARYQLQNDIRKLHVDDSVRYYEIRLANKPIGFLTRQFTRENEPLQRPGRVSHAKEGLRVRERSYRFADDGTVHFSKIDLFSSRDTETDLYELWQVRLGPVDAPLLITRDQCVREGDALFSTYTTSDDQGLPEPRRPLKLDAGYLGLGWARLLPALLGPQPKPMHAFTVYDPGTRTLIRHAIQPLGRKRLPGSPDQLAHAFQTRTGVEEHPGMVYADADGNMLRFEAGQLVLQLTPQAVIEKRFGRQRDSANARLQRTPVQP